MKCNLDDFFIPFFNDACHCVDKNFLGSNSLITSFINLKYSNRMGIRRLLWRVTHVIVFFPSFLSGRLGVNGHTVTYIYIVFMSIIVNNLSKSIVTTPIRLHIIKSALLLTVVLLSTSIGFFIPITRP